MDLVEIRKKSKNKSGGKNVENTASPPTEGPSAGARAPAQPSGEGAGEFQPPAGTAGHRHQVAVSSPAAAAKPAGATPQSGVDVLDALFAATPDLTLATEVEYLQGLEGGDSRIQTEQQQWLTFGLGKEHYALDINFVREIIKPREITDIPRVPAFILGVISLRGVVVPIFDLCRRLNLGKVEIDSRSRIVVCEHGERMAGLLVDQISQVVKFPVQDIEPPPAILSGLDRELVEGVGRIQGKMIILLDLPSVLDVEPK